MEVVSSIIAVYVGVMRLSDTFTSAIDQTSPAVLLPASIAALEQPPSKPALRLQAGMSLAEAGSAVMSHHFGRLLASEAGTIEGSDPEALHDMRVATRRLRATMRVFRDGFDRATLAALAEEVSWLAGVLGRVRDLDVFLLWLADHEKVAGAAEGAAVRLAMEAFAATRARERQELLEVLRSERYAQLKHSLQAALQPLAPQAVSEDDTSPAADGKEQALGSFARGAIRRQLRAVRTWARRPSAGDLERLHRLRIASKRLRYTCEFLADLFPDRLEELIATVVPVQDALGGMRDAHLQRRLVRDLAEAGCHDRALRRGLARLRRALRQQECRRYQSFLEVRPSLLSRPARRRTKKSLRASEG